MRRIRIDVQGIADHAGKPAVPDKARNLPVSRHVPTRDLPHDIVDRVESISSLFRWFFLFKFFPLHLSPPPFVSSRPTDPPAIERYIHTLFHISLPLYGRAGWLSRKPQSATKNLTKHVFPHMVILREIGFRRTVFTQAGCSFLFYVFVLYSPNNLYFEAV